MSEQVADLLCQTNESIKFMYAIYAQDSESSS